MFGTKFPPTTSTLGLYFKKQNEKLVAHIFRTYIFSIPTFLTFLFLLINISNSVAQNAIVDENKLAGNFPSEWDIDGAGDLSIQGFATDISVNKGNTVDFKIDVTDAGKFGIKIYRLGYYGGRGARLITTLSNTSGSLFQGVNQPDPIKNTSTGLVDCGNWSVSASWDIPENAVSGIYIAKLEKESNGGASHIIFIVRDDASSSALLFQTSDATWQAYNVYGGYSLYTGTTSYPSGHAVKVSYNRPFLTRSGGGGGGAEEDWVFNAEYPMLRFLERNGYDVTYTTNVDGDRRGELIKNHKVFLSVGHDEYWSAQHRTHVEAARDAGVHLAFFSGNEVYWKTRWENSVDGNGVSHRTLVCYKEGNSGENICGNKCDPKADEWTGLWRNGCGSTATDACKPENALTGQISWD